MSAVGSLATLCRFLNFYLYCTSHAIGSGIIVWKCLGQILNGNVNFLLDVQYFIKFVRLMRFREVMDMTLSQFMHPVLYHSFLQ